MGRTKTVASSEPTRKMRPAATPEARENQLISLATDLAEKRLREGTASSAEVVHFLKMGSTKEKYELEKVKLETELVRAKTEALQSAKEVETLYKEALSAMRTYSGNNTDAPI